MREKVRNIYSRDREMIRISILSLFSNALKTISAFILGKVMAVFAGPGGLLMVGQINNFISLVYSFASLGLNNAVVKKTAELSPGNIELKPYLSTSYLLMTSASIIIALVLFIMPYSISNWVLGETELYWVFVILACGLPFYVSGQFMLSLFNGSLEYEKVIKSNIYINLLVLINSVVLVYYWGVKGALLAVSLNIFFYFLVPVLIKKKSLSLIVERHFDKTTLKSLFSFSVMFIVNSIALPVSQILQRKYLLSEYGLEYAGLWEAINRISTLINLFLSSTLALYYLPRISASTSYESTSGELKRMALYLIPFSVLLMIGLFVFKDFVVLLLFSSKFSGIKSLFIWQLPGDLIRISSALFAYVLIAKERTFSYVFGEVLAALIWLFLTYYLVPHYNLQGASIAYSLTYFIYFIWVWFFYKLKKV